MRGRGTRAAFALLITAALFGCAPVPVGCRLILATTLPARLVLHGSKIAVPAMLDDRPILLLVDTGSERTVLDRSAVDAADRSQPGGTVSGIGGSQIADQATLRLRIGDLHGVVPGEAIDFDPKSVARGISGLIGMDILGAYDVDLDLPAGQMRVYATRGQCRQPTVVMRAPLFAVDELPARREDLRPHVPVEIDGKVLEGMLDTGAPGVLLSGRAARTLGLSEGSMANDRVITVTGAGRRRVRGHVHLLASLTLGDLTLRAVPALVLQESFDPEVDVLLGMDIARRIHFWLSNSSHRLVMEYPPMPSPGLAP